MKSKKLGTLVFLGLIILASSYFTPPVNHKNTVVALYSGFPINTNIIQNPDFTQNTCQTSCYWTNSNFQQSYLPGWQPNPAIEFGPGTSYSSALGSKQVVKIGPSTNNGIAQNLGDLIGGTYTFTFEYMAIPGKANLNTRFGVSIANKQLGVVIVENYNINKASCQIEIMFPYNDLTLRFNGLGNSYSENESNGIVLLNVQMSLVGKASRFSNKAKDPNNPEIYSTELLGKTVSQVSGGSGGTGGTGGAGSAGGAGGSTQYPFPSPFNPNTFPSQPQFPFNPSTQPAQPPSPYTPFPPQSPGTTGPSGFGNGYNPSNNGLNLLQNFNNFQSSFPTPNSGYPIFPSFPNQRF